VEFECHWLSLTIWDDPGKVAAWVCRLLQLDGGLDRFRQLPNGGRGFREIFLGPGGVKLYVTPVTSFGFVHLEIPGEVIKAIVPDWVRVVVGELDCKWQATRLDLAFVSTIFNPGDVRDAVMARELRTLAKRSTFREISQPFKGGHTVYLGSRQSERMLRVYRDGEVTRTELECKEKRADAVFRNLLATDGDLWPVRALAHLRDFVDFKTGWWTVFCDGAERAYMTLSNWAAVSFDRTRAWVEKQVAPTLALIEELIGVPEILRLLEVGREKFGERQLALKAAYVAI
jgi:DNA relaxase NicK